MNFKKMAITLPVLVGLVAACGPSNPEPAEVVSRYLSALYRRDFDTAAGLASANNRQNVVEAFRQSQMPANSLSPAKTELAKELDVTITKTEINGGRAQVWYRQGDFPGTQYLILQNGRWVIE